MPSPWSQAGHMLDPLQNYAETLWQGLPYILAGVVIFTLFYLVSGFLGRAAQEGLEDITDDRRAGSAWSTIVRYLTVLTGILAGLTVAGVDLTALMVALGVVGFAVAFAMQETLGNFISGIIILTTHPFAVGDAVEVSGIKGKVEAIGIRATKLRTFDGLRVEVPNQKVLNKDIWVFNYHQTRRVEIVIGIGYGDDIARAGEIIRDAMVDVETVLEEPSPMVLIEEYADSRVDLNVRVWLDTSEGRRSWLLTRAEAARTAKEALEAEGIRVPWPIRTLHRMHEDGRGNGDGARGRSGREHQTNLQELEGGQEPAAERGGDASRGAGELEGTA